MRKSTNKETKKPRNQTKAKATHYHQTFSENFFQLELTKLQKPIVNILRSNKISILTGDPGTGKDAMSLYYALDLLKDHAIEKILILKPMVEVGKTMGFLPGSESEKLSVYNRSSIDNLERLIGAGKTSSYINGKQIEFEAINFVRGASFYNAVVILTEAQNATLHELVSLATRLAASSTLVLNGDISQSDIRNSGLSTFIELFKDFNGIEHVDLGDEYQMRDPFIVSIYNAYKEYRKINNL